MTEEKQATTTSPATQETPEDKFFTIKAQFEGFELGDANHFFFKTETGAIIDFGASRVDNFEFAELLPEEEIDESNQGWGSNMELVGKWFILTYVIQQEELYIGWPHRRCQRSYDSPARHKIIWLSKYSA